MSNTKITALHKAARDFAIAGIPVFPCVPDGKAPACEGGFKAATTDLARIDAWWADADFNVAISPHDVGWCVVDIEAEALDTWVKLGADNGTPETYTVCTPRGGLHYYYEGELPPSVRKLEPGAAIDTRGIGSYVLVPPSIVNGKPYEVLHDRDIAPVPLWVQTRVAASADKRRASVAELDLPGSIDRARALLVDLVGRGDVAIEFRGGNDRSYRLACEILNLGLSTDAAHTLLSEIWNPACQPPWSDDELSTIITNAASYAQNEAGAWAVAPAAEVFGTALDKLPTPQERRSRFHLEDEEEQDVGTDPLWTIPGLIQQASTVLMVGATQSYKSFLALDVALSIAAGRPAFGLATNQGPSVYAALEGRSNIKRARRRAWRIGRGVEGPIRDFYVTTAPMVALADQIQEFGDEISKRLQGNPPKLIVLDTLSKCMAGLNENDARDAGIFVRFCDSLVEAFGCSVLAIHHTGKDDGRGARGSSAFHAGFDTVLEVKAHRPTKAVEVWVRKHKDADEPEKPWTFEGRVIGQSLVFFPTDASAHRQLTEGEDLYSPRAVGAALQSLGAYGIEHAVTTTVLASQLTPMGENEAVDQHQAAVSRCARTLGAAAKGRLNAYCERHGSGLSWSLPAPSPKGD